MHLTVLTHTFRETPEDDLTIHRYCQVRPQIAILEEALPHPRETLFQGVNEVSQRLPGHTYLCRTSRKVLHHSRDKDHCHTTSSFSRSFVHL
jgi:hypothetical protein